MSLDKIDWLVAVPVGYYSLCFLLSCEGMRLPFYLVPFTSVQSSLPKNSCIFISQLKMLQYHSPPLYVRNDKSPRIHT